MSPPRGLAGWGADLTRYLDRAVATLKGEERTVLKEQITLGVGPADIDVAYELRGNSADPAVLLIMGLGAQLVNWPTGFLDALVARGHYVIRFDNRDAGHSTHFDNAPPPDLAAALAGDLSSVAYTLADMAAGAVGLLDVLGIDAAHVVGASMGGAIGQVMAIEYPRRVRSVTSMMSTTGDTAVGQIHPESMRAVFGGPPATTKEEVVARSVRIAPVVRSPNYPTPPAEIAATAELAWERDHDQIAIARQAVASVASGDRTNQLRDLTLPTLVIHGTQDTMCDVSGGHATAAAIPGAELVLIEGMGHDLPRPLWDGIADHIAALIRRSRIG